MQNAGSDSILEALDLLGERHRRIHPLQTEVEVELGRRDPEVRDGE